MSRKVRQKKTSYRPSPSLSDMIFGSDEDDDYEEQVYGLLVTSLEHKDNKLLAQLRGLTDKSIIFQRLPTVEYEKSSLPMASDENPLGDTRASAVGLIVNDCPWGPNVLENDGGDDENPNYWQIIEAAQELALSVVFIFIKGNNASKDYDGVLYPKFHNIAKGPWPRKAPYVFLLSYYEKLNKAQLEALKHCLTTEDPLKIRITFKNHVAEGKEYLQKQNAYKALETLGVQDPKEKEKEKEVEGGSIDKGKENNTPAKPERELTLADIKRQLFKENEKQWTAVKAQLTELRKEVADLKKGLHERDEEIKTLKTAQEPPKPAAEPKENLLH